MRSSTHRMARAFLIVVAMIISTDAVNNTTQFDNFTIEWEDFSIFTCAVPTTYTASLFGCAPRINTIQVEDISCLQAVTIDFDQTTCQSVTTPRIDFTTASPSTRVPPISTQSTSRATSNPTTAGSTATTARMTTPTATSMTSSASQLLSTNTNSPTEMTSVGITASPMTSTAMPPTSSASTAPSSTMSTCPDGLIGVYCNVSSDACAMSQPCENAATCFPNRTLPLGYYCHCHPDYTGYNCELDRRPCREDTCWHNGTCIPMNSTVAGYNGSNFRCLCSRGYDGVHCELKINYCSDVICENRGVCHTIDMEWECVCLDSSYYYGDHCEYKTSQLRLREIISKSFASVAIGAIVTTCSFVIIMDFLKYACHIDPVKVERDSYRRRRELNRRRRRPLQQTGPKIALRFQYIS